MIFFEKPTYIIHTYRYINFKAINVLDAKMAMKMAIRGYEEVI